jgi:hypothetical protein
MCVVTAQAAQDRPVEWSKYERKPRADGTTSTCLEHRQGIRGTANERTYVFRVFNDCNRSAQVSCDVNYAPTCSYGEDVERVGHLDTKIEPYGEGPVFGRFALPAAGKVQGCFYARCSEADPALSMPLRGSSVP